MAPGAALQTASVVTFALCEVVGLWGFVLFVVAGSAVDRALTEAPCPS